jgi:hypothetical protein
MTERYSSFLIRYWRLRSEQRRVEVERIQSGERRCFAALAEALAWIEAQGDAPAEGGSATTSLPRSR